MSPLTVSTFSFTIFSSDASFMFNLYKSILLFGLMRATRGAFGTLLVVIAALVMVGAESNQQGVMLLDEVSLDRTVAEHEHVVVFLSQDDC